MVAAQSGIASVQKYFGDLVGKTVPVGEGITGQCYALPTMEGGVDYIQGKVDKFLAYANQHPELTFLVTPIACGIAGFTPQQIAPLFKDALDIKNVLMPKQFVTIISTL